MKWIQFFVLFLALVSTARANVVISEIMYNPSQGSDTDLEWVEIYNTGSSPVDLTAWKLDGSNFDDITINPGEYVVIARELVDGTDDDNESFEWHYGNGDGTWDSNDGNYKAVDGSFSLTDDDMVILSSDTYADSVNYSSSWGAKGNGKTLYKINLNGGNIKENWAESIFDGGTPGKNKNNNGILVSLQVVGTSTVINSIIFADDLPADGYQILPVAGSKRLMALGVEVDSQQDVNAYAELNGNRLELSQTQGNSSLKVFSGNLEMQFYDSPGDYTINVSVTDQNKKTTYKLVEFEYVPLISSVFDVEEINFGSVVSGGSSSEKGITIKNAGNVVIDISAAATDLKNGGDVMDVSSMQIKTGSGYVAMSKTPMSIDLNLGTGIDASKQVYFKINVPADVNPNMYYGIINLNAIEG